MRTSHAFCRIAQGRGERRIPRSGDALGRECRMPFIGPLKGACPSLCPQKARRHSLLENAK